MRSAATTTLNVAVQLRPTKPTRLLAVRHRSMSTQTQAQLHLPWEGQSQICLQLRQQFGDARELPQTHLLAVRRRGCQNGVAVVPVTVASCRLWEMLADGAR